MKKRVDTVDAAVALAKQGLAVFPVKADDKTPVCRWKDEATTDRRDVQDLFRKHPGANIGVATGAPSGHVVLDIDVKNGARGNRSFNALQDELGNLKETALVRTPSGGRHYWYRYGKSGIRCSVGALGPGLDVRADDGYVVVPPSSIHGRSYEWVRGIEEAQPLPRELRELMSLSRRAKELRGESGGGFSQIAERIEEGERNRRLFEAACSMRHKGFDGEAIFAALCVVNEKQCVTPLPEAEVRTIVRSVVERYEKGKGRSAPPTEAFDLAKHSESVASIFRRDVAPVEYMLHGFLARGASSLLSGPPKGFKSTFALWLSLVLVGAVESEWKAFRVVPEQPLRVGYIDLEQDLSLFKERLADFRPNPKKLKRLIRLDKLPPLDEHGVKTLETFIKDNDLQFCFIDTVQTVRPAVQGRSATGADTAFLAPITELAHRTRCHISALAHNGKRKDTDNPLEMIAATSALPAAVDDVFVLYRAPNAQDERQRYLYMTGRHIRNPGTFAIERTRSGFNYLGETVELVEGQLQKQVLAFLKAERGPASPMGIANALGVKRLSIQKVLAKLCDNRLITHATHGMYALPEFSTRRGDV